jgi:hypothetical protein
MRAIAAACTASCIPATANAKRAEAAKAQLVHPPGQIDGTLGLPPPLSFGLPYHFRRLLSAPAAVVGVTQVAAH